MRPKISAFARRILIKLIPEDIRDSFCVCQSEPQPISALFPTKLDEVQNKFAFTDTAKIDEALAYCEHLYAEEEKRSELVENKATVLASFTGAAIAAILGILAVSPNQGAIKPLNLAFLFLIALALVLSVHFALKVFALRIYHTPDPRKIFELADRNIEDVKKERAAEYFHSFVQNHDTNSRKMDNFRCAQTYARSGAFLAIIFIAALGFSNLLWPPMAVILTPTSTPIYTLTPTLTSTPTQTATASSTVIFTPTSTILATPKP